MEKENEMKKNIFKKVIAGAMALTMVFSMTACGGGKDSGSAAGDSGEKTKLYVVNWKDYASDDADYVKQFEEENNCEIVNTYMDSEEDLLTRLKTSGAGEIDVCLPNCSILPAAIKEGLLEPIDTSKLTNFDSLFERFKTQEECFGEDGKMYLPHTLNNTVVAPPRMLIAFLENNLQADGSVLIPKVLQPYMGGKTVLIPKK